MPLLVGDHAPWFKSPSTSAPNYAFDTVGGRYVVMAFFASATAPETEEVIGAFLKDRGPFDDQFACFFGVSNDPKDQNNPTIQQSLPGFRYFWDFELKIAKLYGLIEESTDQTAKLARVIFVLNPRLQVMKIAPFSMQGAEDILGFLKTLPAPESFTGQALQAPFLYIPNVFEPALCQALMEYYHQNNPEPSGFMRERDGKTVLMLDPNFKRRKDVIIEDQALIAATQTRFARRIAPELKRVFYFNANRMERYIVACYDEAERSFFKAHRDNTTKGTAHRRFAVSVNLNDDFEGGRLSFPEYGPQSYKPKAGDAIVFSCSLLHAVSETERGTRYVFLPFLYDDAAAQLREANNPYLDENLPAYRADITAGS